MPNRLIVPAAAAVLLFAGSAVAQQQQTMPAPSTPQQMQRAVPMQQQPSQAGQRLSSRDRDFVREAALGGMAEVELGRLAQQNAGNPQVKEFGARMVHDHSMANNQLSRIANAQGARMPQQLSRKYQETRDRLSRLHGAAFDRAYMRNMVNDHNEDIQLFRRQARTGQNQSLRQFAQQTLPVLDQHDRMAYEIDRSLTATGSSYRR
jgi:putative membrane protein